MKKFYQFEYLFVVIALIMGWKMTYTNPPWQSNDEDRHFFNAYALTEGIIGPQYDGNFIGQELPDDLYNSVRSFQGIPFSQDAKISKSYVESAKKKKVNKRKRSFFKNTTSSKAPVGYIPAALGISLAKLFNKGALDIGYWARLFSLFAYIIILFFAIKEIPKGAKEVLFVVALSPMILYQAASVSYDGLTLALLSLFLALTMKYYQNILKIGWRQVALLVSLVFIQRIVKDGYFLLYFVALVIPMKRFENKTIYFGMVTGLLMAAFLPSYIWSLYINSLEIPYEARNFFQKDFHFNTGLNLKQNLNQPIEFLTLIFQNIFAQGKVWLRGAIGRFGYSYSLLPVPQIIAWYLLIVVAASHKRIATDPRFTLIVGLLASLNVLMVVVGFFVASPVGSHFIYGLQGRYFSPILPFIALAFLKFNLIKVDENYWKAGLSICTLVLLFMSVQFMDGYFYNP